MKKAYENIEKINKTKNERSLFVKNLGWLLSQTKEGITKCEYIPEEEIVQVHYVNKDIVIAPVEGANFKGIIIDVLAAMLIKEKENGK